ncbi:MAG: hypothetical protein DYG98_15725 [Haliscomenobacteraceae bacterium CHB4]|nr:hypothetical protein [Haliscomenobacteraceae bacterium CHB4]
MNAVQMLFAPVHIFLNVLNLNDMKIPSQAMPARRAASRRPMANMVKTSGLGQALSGIGCLPCQFLKGRDKQDCMAACSSIVSPVGDILGDMAPLMLSLI